MSFLDSFFGAGVCEALSSAMDARIYMTRTMLADTIAVIAA